MNASRNRRFLLPLGLLTWLTVTGAAATELPLVREVQQRLATLGYDPGPADGIAGERTRLAIMAFERNREMPATGDASPDLLQLLRSEADAARQPNEAPGTEQAQANPGTAHPAAVAEAGAAPPLAGTTWSVRDETGAAFPITLEPDGRVASPGLGRGWSWTQDGHELRLAFDNRVGGRTTRSGALLSDREMAGTGESSRGLEWTWQASRTK